MEKVSMEKVMEITTGPLEEMAAEQRRQGAPPISLHGAAPWDDVIRCAYTRPAKDSVPNLGWQVGKHAGNSVEHLRYVMEYNWKDAKEAAQRAVSVANGGVKRLAMGCDRGLYRSPACATIAAIALKELGYAVRVRHVALEARATHMGAEYAGVLTDLTPSMTDDDIAKWLPQGLMDKIRSEICVPPPSPPPPERRRQQPEGKAAGTTGRDARTKRRGRGAERRRLPVEGGARRRPRAKRAPCDAPHT